MTQACLVAVEISGSAEDSEGKKLPTTNATTSALAVAGRNCTTYSGCPTCTESLCTWCHLKRGPGFCFSIREPHPRPCTGDVIQHDDRCPHIPPSSSSSPTHEDEVCRLRSSNCTYCASSALCLWSQDISCCSARADGCAPDDSCARDPAECPDRPGRGRLSLVALLAVILAPVALIALAFLVALVVFALWLRRSRKRKTLWPYHRIVDSPPTNQEPPANSVSSEPLANKTINEESGGGYQSFPEFGSTLSKVPPPLPIVRDRSQPSLVASTSVPRTIDRPSSFTSFNIKEPPP